MERKEINKHPFVLHEPKTFEAKEMVHRSQEFYHQMNTRRTVRDFSSKEVPFEVIENIVKTASSAPSGAHKQPWTFCVVSNPTIKKRIREEAEKEEYRSYNGRMNKDWIEDLEPLGTDWHKPFLEIAPYLIIVFKKLYGKGENDIKKQHYYVTESVGLACGFLLTAIHNAGLVSLTHTPSPMKFLSEVLNRPENEKPFLLIPVGYPAEKVFVPDIQRKALEDVMEKYD